jgi:acyl transferase domain-containing protein/acyl carrier protein
MESGLPPDGSIQQRALRAIADLQARLAAAEGARTEPIAVVGMGCRFPGADDPAAFWRLLAAARDAVGPQPAARWDVEALYDPDPEASGKISTRHGAFLEDVAGFDTAFFGISPREAARLDPQHRLVLEVGWEALESAGIAPGGLRGSRTGVFLGIGQNGYGRRTLHGDTLAQVETYDGTGNLLCFAPGRLAYILGLEGPVLAIDTACSSSLVAVHQACLSLRAGECDLALAGGVHLILAPEVGIFLSRARVLAPDGRCKGFDAAADGFGRGEGCGLIVLKRLADARRDRDDILALVRGSAVNHDGASGGLTVPSEPAQERLIRQALRNADLAPGRIGYVEAHGTGTPLGDPIEVNALAAALCGDRPADAPLLIGSVKGNLGHLEAAAGIAGVIKVLLSLRHGVIPAHLQFRSPNPRIDWQASRIAVVAEGRPWPVREGGRIAGVSSFGFSGTNGHVILGEPLEPPTRQREARGRAHCLTLSAKTDAALAELVRRFARHLAGHPELPIEDLCFTANVGRTPFARRLAIVAATREELRDCLAAAQAGRSRPGLYRQGPETPPPADPTGGVPASPEDAAARFVRGEEIGWGAYYQGAEVRKTPLPTYPFQRQRHWVAASPTAAPANRGTPPWGRRLPLPFSEEVRFASSVGEGCPPHLMDHCLLGTVVVSAATQMALVLGAAAEAFGSRAREIRRMEFAHPLLVPAGERREVQLVFAPIQEGEHDFWLASRPDPTARAADWTLHASGAVGPPAAALGGVCPSAVVCEGAATGDREPLVGEAFYAARRRHGYECGPTFQLAERIRWGPREAECRVAPLSPDAEDAYPIHPGILDACLQMVGGLSDGDPEHLLLPVRIGRLAWHRPASGKSLVCRACREPDGAGGVRSGALELRSEDGAPIVDADGVAFRPAPRGLFGRDAARGGQTALCEICWPSVPRPATEGAGPAARRPGDWLLFVDDSGIGAELAAALRAAGARVISVSPAPEYCRIAADRYGVPPEGPGEFRRLAEAIGAGLAGSVFLWGVDLAGTDGGAIGRCEILCTAVALLVRALAERGGGPPVWVVTRGAQAVAGGPAAPLQAALWGLAGVAEIEHPELAPRCIDLDPAAPEGQIARLADELLQPDDETRIAFRGTARHAARLAPCEARGGAAVCMRADATYLITGGLGDLGLEVAAWLASQGARWVALAGRRAPGPPALEQIARIEGTGCRIRVFAADVADRGEVERLLREIAAAMPALAGIVHAAGVVEDALLLRQERSRFAAVMAPKVRGAYNLQQATADLPLDFFVCFSSAAAVLGAGGQANYAAANACLDAFAHARRAAGQHGLSVNWGAWGQVGMATRMGESARARLAARGIGGLASRQALGLLAALLAQDATQALALVVDWERYLASSRRVPPLFARLRPGGPAPESGPIGSGLAAIGEAERRPRLLAYLRSQLAATLGVAVPEDLELRQRFFDLGMDSLMAVEMRHRLERGLGVPLRSTLLFDYPTLEALAVHLEEAIAPEPAQLEEAIAPEPAQGSGELAALLTELATLSEAELRARLGARDGRIP